MVTLIAQVFPIPGFMDSVVWGRSVSWPSNVEVAAEVGRVKFVSNMFTSSVGYKYILNAKETISMEEWKSNTFRTLWKMKVLANIRAFGWRFFLYCVATKD